MTRSASTTFKTHRLDSRDPDFCAERFELWPRARACSTIEAVSTVERSHPPLEVEVLGDSFCCIERMENPISIKVRTGTEVLVNVEIPERSTTSESFIVTTSMSP